jgi:hypothetical protein
MLKGNSLMSHIAKRLASAAASALVLSLVSTAGQAQTDVLTLSGSQTTELNASHAAFYTFNTSMILNSIGFVVPSAGIVDNTGYAIGTNFYYINSNDLRLSSKDANNVVWLTINQSMNAGDVLRVITLQSTTVGYSANSGTNVTYHGFTIGNPPPEPLSSYTFNTSRTNSNIRVTALGASVAPEPGSIALLLTGGGALAGIALLRRRNAA